MKFQADHRTNGLVYVEVTEDGRPAGAFSVPAASWPGLRKGLKGAAEVAETAHGEPLPQPTKARKARSQDGAPQAALPLAE